MKNAYFRFFELDEFEKTPVLRWVTAAILLGMTLLFSDGFEKGAGAIHTDDPLKILCPSFWQSCDRFVFLFRGPEALSHHVFYAFCVMGPLILAGWFLYRRVWVGLHLILAYLFFLTILLFFGFYAGAPVPYLIFNLVPASVILFSRRRVPDLRWTFLLLYFLAAVAKLDDGWIAGSYFNSLSGGLPGLPDFGLPIYTNLILLTELVVLWFLLHKAKAVRNTLLALFVLFHLYSAIFVGFRFPLLTLPMLLFLFTIDEVHSDRGLTSTGIVLTILLIMMNAGPVALGLNPKLTGQGAQFALNMFDANRQAVFKYEIIYGDREPVKVETSHFDAFDRDRPYNQWYRLKKMCGDPSIKQISYNILLSANGGPFREIVNLNNVCESEFLPFSPNSWIQLNGPVKGYPGKNYYWLERDAGSVQQVKIYPEAQIQTGVIGDFISKNLTTCKRLYWLVAVAVFSIMSTPYLRRKLGLRL